MRWEAGLIEKGKRRGARGLLPQLWADAEGSSLVRMQVRGEGQGGGWEGEEKEGGGKVAVGIPPQLWADAECSSLARNT